MLLFQYYLLEIKYRIFYLLLSIISTFIISYTCFEEIFYILALPIMLVTSTSKFIYTDISEIFFTSINFSLISSLFINLPLLYFHIWLFMIPALYKYERYKLNIFLISSLCFIIIGFLFAYFILIPLTWNYFFKLEINSILISIHLEPKINEYFYNFYISLIFFIIIFQLPIIFYYLIYYKILMLDLFILKRHLIIFISLVISSLISSPDIINLLITTIPLYLFNEIIIFYFIYNNKI